MDRLIDEIVVGAKADSFCLYLTGDTNFRYQVYPEYKATRLDQYRPRHLGALRDYALSLGAALSVGCEADDLLGIAQCADVDNTVICTLDKDLLMIPGNHYSWEISGVTYPRGPAVYDEAGNRVGGKRWVKEAVSRNVSEEEALHWFYTQVLTGDTADNIKGASGVGKVTAKECLEGLFGTLDERAYYEAVLPHFSCEEELEMNAKVLWIWRREGDIWKLPETSGTL